MLHHVIYDRDRILISDTVARFGYTSDAISAIRGMRVNPPKRSTGIAILGVILTLVASILVTDFGFELYKRRMLTFEDEEFGALLLGLAGIGAALLWTSNHHSPYQLVLRTLGGEVVVHASKDRHELFEIKRAIECAVSLNAEKAVFGFRDWPRNLAAPS